MRECQPQVAVCALSLETVVIVLGWDCIRELIVSLV